MNKFLSKNRLLKSNFFHAFEDNFASDCTIWLISAFTFTCPVILLSLEQTWVRLHSNVIDYITLLCLKNVIHYINDYMIFQCNPLH